MISNAFLVWYVGDLKQVGQVQRAISAIKDRFAAKFYGDPDVVMVAADCPAVFLEALREEGMEVKQDGRVFQFDMWMGRQSPPTPL